MSVRGQSLPNWAVCATSAFPLLATHILRIRDRRAPKLGIWSPKVGAPRTNMKRGIAILASLGALMTVAYFTESKWAILQETLTFNDPARDNRPVAVDIAVRRDKKMQANAGMIKLPVAILNHGATVKFTEYSFLANVFAARGYMTISIQHDLPTDAPMVTTVGELYVGRLPQIQRGIANIRFAVEEMKKVEPNADYDHLNEVGHSNAGAHSGCFC